jgi:hypothetical protein
MTKLPTREKAHAERQRKLLRWAEFMQRFVDLNHDLREAAEHGDLDGRGVCGALDCLGEAESSLLDCMPRYQLPK